MDGRQFLTLMAVDGGAVFASALPGCTDLTGLRKEGAADFDQPGAYAFLCDNVCGDGHEQMNGLLVVQA
jgi:heme/copper-type cytochrome/quinol oxidase subunit 2